MVPLPPSDAHGETRSHSGSAARSLALLLEQDRTLLADPRTGRVHPSRRLCSALRCSARTLCQAFNLLSQGNIIVKSRGFRSPWILASSRSSPGSQPSLPDIGKPSRAEAIADELRERIVRSRYPLGRLPSAKAFRAEFACNHGTLAAALRLLGRQGLLREIGGRFTIARNAVGRGDAPSVWLPESISSFARLTQWERLALAGVEQTLTDLGWGQLRLLVRDLSERNSLRVDRQAAGYVNFYRQGRGSWWKMLERAALRHGIPSVLIDLTDLERQEKHRKADRKLRWIKTDNLEAGRTVGAYLVAKGHRRMAFLSAYPFREIDTYPLHRDWNYPLWARKRYLGMAEILRPLRQGSLEAFDATAHIGFVRAVEARENLLPLSVNRLRERLVRDPWLDASDIDEAFGSMQNLLETAEDGHGLKPWFESVLSQTRATAWVCSNDRLAFLAMRFLKQRGRRIPDDMAVVGFDNTLEASRSGLTSFDLGMREIGALAVHLLADPRGVKLDKENTAFVSGRLIPRETG